MRELASIREVLSSEHLAGGLRALVRILAFRLFPFAAFATIGRGIPWPMRGSAIALYAALSCLVITSDATAPAWFLLACAYHCGAGWVAFELLPHVRSRAAWFGVSVVLFWLLPLAVVRPTPMPFLVIGWDVTLSAYSYGSDTRGRSSRSLRDCLFFLLVNPVLVYRNRGDRVSAPSLGLQGALRSGLGTLAILLSVGVLEPLHAELAARASSAGAVGGDLLVLVGGFRLVSEYAAQSGVASLQIGLMRQLGYRLPERYRYPLFASSPAAFWRRWNTYVGDWARMYVFLPLMLGMSRRAPGNRASRALVYGAAVIATFGIVGLLHDAFVVAAASRLEAPGTKWFLAAGALVVGWEFAATRLRGSAPAQRSRQWFERGLFLLCACYAAAHLWW